MWSLKQFPSVTDHASGQCHSVKGVCINFYNHVAQTALGCTWAFFPMSRGRMPYQCFLYLAFKRKVFGGFILYVFIRNVSTSKTWQRFSKIHIKINRSFSQQVQSLPVCFKNVLTCLLKKTVLLNVTEIYVYTTHFIWTRTGHWNVTCLYFEPKWASVVLSLTCCNVIHFWCKNYRHSISH